MDSKNNKLLRELIRECIMSNQHPAVLKEGPLNEREFYTYDSPDGQGQRFPRGINLFGKENPTSLGDVGLVHSLVTPAYRTLFGGGLNPDGTPRETRGLFGLVTSLAGVVTGLLGAVFSKIGSLGGSASAGISQDVASGQSRRFTRNTSSGQASIREYAYEDSSVSAEDHLQRVSADANQIVSDYFSIASQTDIDSMNRTISEIFQEYDPAGIRIPSAETLLEEAVATMQSSELENLSAEQVTQLKRDIEEYTLNNVKSESRRVFLDILAQLKDYAGLAGGPRLASDSDLLHAYDLMFQRASEQISFN
tara:strand:+ start:5734 stop:6657 length:924 start_codon:yes stop_codon:yes gene_type:complete